jgi:hypothetical protein
MFSSHLRKSFRSLLLLLAVLSLGGSTAQAQEAERRGAEPDAPEQVASARGVSKGTALVVEVAAAERFGSPDARMDYSNPVSHGLRSGFKFDSEDAAERFGVPTRGFECGLPPASSSLYEPREDASSWQDPQDPQTSSAPKPVPLTPGEKMERAFRRAFLSPVPYATSAFSAIITQLGEDDLPHKTTGDKVADGLTRMAINFGRSATRTVFTGGVYASLFKQDPRYDRSRGKGIGGKVLHGLSRVFVTRDDDWNIEPNYSRFAGNFTASALSNAWERSTPGHDRIGWDATFRRFGRMFLNDAITNILFRELLPDIF